MTHVFQVLRPALVSLVVGILLAGPGLAFADSGTPAAPDVKALVRSLGSPRFSARERAMSQLIHYGSNALAAVRQGVDSEDREIRFRCRRIVKIVEADEFQRRLRAFAAGGAAGRRIKLPGWDLYSKKLGSDDVARRLFVEMQKCEPELMRAVQESPALSHEILTRRVTEIQNSVRFNMSGRLNQVQLGTVAAILFAANNQTRSYPLQTSQYISACLQYPTFRSAVEAGEERELLRKMLGTWIENAKGWTAYQGMMMAMQYNIAQGLVAAKRILKDAPNQPSQPYFRYYALLAVAKFGNATEIPMVEPFLKDKALCGLGVPVNGKTKYRTQIRDIALVVLVHLTKQDPKQFGFEHLRKNSLYMFDPNSLAFANDQQREAAIGKWRKFWHQQQSNSTDAKAVPAAPSSSAG